MRFALSSDEILVELRDKSQRSKHVIKRLCKTLTKSIDVSSSDIQLLKDFIIIKLRKQEETVQWNDFGYDIADFTIPQTTQMKSNFLKSIAPALSESENTAAESEDNKETEEERQKTAEELAEEKRERIANAMHRARHAAISFLNLNCDTIYEIH